MSAQSDFWSQLNSLLCSGQRITLDLDPIQAVVLISHLLHSVDEPAIGSSRREIARTVIEQLAAQFEGCAAIEEAIRRERESSKKP